MNAEQNKLMPYLQFISALIILALFVAITILPMLGMDTADPATVETAKNVMLILVGYLFGSAAGSAKKDETIANLTAVVPAAPTPPAVPDPTVVPITERKP